MALLTHVGNEFQSFAAKSENELWRHSRLKLGNVKSVPDSLNRITDYDLKKILYILELRYEYIYIPKLGPGIFYSLLTSSVLIRAGPLFFRGVRRGLGNFPQKWCTAKTENKVVQMEMGKNIEQVRASASTIISWIFLC